MEEKTYTREHVGIGSRFPRAWKLGMGTLTVAATLSLAACGGGNNNNGNGGGNNKSSGGSGNSPKTSAVSGGSTMGGSTMMGGGSTMMSGGTTGMMGGSTMMSGGSTAMGGGSTMMGGRITGIQAILNAKNPASIVGKRARLSGVQVQNVVSDTAFTVGPSAGKQVPAVLIREVMGKKAEKAVNINKGQKLMLVGTVRKIPKVEAARKRLGLGSAASLKGKQVFLAVRKVKVTGK